MTLEYVLKQHGLINGQNVTLNFDVQFNMMAGAFEGGTGDYTTLFEPTASDFVAAGKGHIVASVGEESGEVPYTAFMCTKKYFEKNEETIRSFLRAVYRAIDYLKDTQPAESAKKLVPQFAGTSEASIASTIVNYNEIDAWMTDMSMKEEAFNRLQDIMTSAGELDKRADFDKLVNNTYAGAVYTEVFG